MASGQFVVHPLSMTIESNDPTNLHLSQALISVMCNPILSPANIIFCIFLKLIWTTNSTIKCIVSSCSSAKKSGKQGGSL